MVSTSMNAIIAVGASTGGPRALQTLLSHFSPDVPASIVVVQHMPPRFTKSLAKRLDGLCSLHVTEAEDGQPLQNGSVYIAPGDFHMRVVSSPKGGFQISLRKDPPYGGHRPSVDVLFHSLVVLPSPPRLFGVLLTGMGRDGAEGLAAIKASGGTTIAEAEESCIVFGMPKAAIEKGCVDWVLPVDQIAERLKELIEW
jgi:two-component system chemotaxis response regulator CheB